MVPDPGDAASRDDRGPQAGLGALRVVLGLQVALGLLWGVSMLSSPPVSSWATRPAPHMEKIAMEGGAT